MKKNVSGQVVVAQLVSKTDGSAVTTGTTTCYVLGDGGTQAAGSVGAGACTHEGNGVWSYVPAQAETNYDHVAFTFVNSSAVNVTVQIYTSFPQTGDAYSKAADVETDTADIQSRLPAALVSGRIDASVGAMAANTVTASAVAADAVTEIQAGLSTLDAAGVRAAVGLASANLDTQLGAIDDFIDTEVAAIKAVTDKLDDTLEDSGGGAFIFTTAALAQAPSGSGASASDIADAVWDEATADHQTAGTTGKALTSASSAGDPWTTEFDGKTAGEILQHLAAFAFGKTTIVKVGAHVVEVTFRAIDDSADRIVATVNRSERTGITLTP